MDKPVDPVINPIKPSKLVSSGIKTVRTNTDQDNPDRMEVINSTKDRVRARFYDAKQSALLKLKKTNNTIKEMKGPDRQGEFRPRPGRKKLKNGKTVTQQKWTDAMKDKPKVKLVGDMNDREFAEYIKNKKVVKEDALDDFFKAQQAKFHQPPPPKPKRSKGGTAAATKPARPIKKKVGHVRAAVAHLVGGVALHGTGKLGHWVKRKIRGEQPDQFSAEQIALDEKWFGLVKDKPKSASDQFRAMHQTLEKHGYHTKDFKTYHHEGGEHRAHLRVSSITNGHIELGKPQTVHSSGHRFHDANELDKHLKAVHSVKKEELEMTENLEVMIDAAINKQPGEFKTAFGAEMETRVDALIQGYKQELAKTMFNPPSEDPEEDIEPEVEPEPEATTD